MENDISEIEDEIIDKYLDTIPHKVIKKLYQLQLELKRETGLSRFTTHRIYQKSLERQMENIYKDIPTNIIAVLEGLSTQTCRNKIKSYWIAKKKLKKE